MRIVSKYRDYYDSIQRTGMDQECVYVRQKRDIVDILPYLYQTKFYSLEYGENLGESNGYILGYCGQFYKIFEIEIYSRGTVPAYYEYYHDYEQYKARKAKLLALGRTAPTFYYRYRHKARIKGRSRQFIEQNLSRFEELFHKYQVPLFLIHKGNNRHTQLYRDDKAPSINGSHITLNPQLDLFKFQQVKDPYTCYQDIFQYVAGVLNQRENNMIKIQDKDLIAKHGYDKWSFRKEPKSK